jgi:hypothetical protein
MDIEMAQEHTTSALNGQGWTRWRMWTIRIWYGLLSLWALSMSQWAVRLGQADPGERFTYGSVTAWKLLAVGGVLGICWTAGRSVVAFHALVVGSAAWALSERLYAVPPPDDSPIISAVATAVLWMLPLVLVRPRRRELVRPHLRPSAILLPLALAAAVPLSIYAVRQGDLATSFERPTMFHYDACTLGAVVAAQAVLAALRPRASRWLPRLVAFAAAWIGLLAVIWPHDVASSGRGWGGVLICWALLFAAAAEVEARRDPKQPLPSATTTASPPGPIATG